MVDPIAPVTPPPTPAAPPGLLRDTLSPPRPVAAVPPVGPVVVPVLSSIAPVVGPAGTSVVLTGTGFTGATAVSFGSTAATSFAVTSDTSITAIAPVGTGPSDVTVVTPGGTSKVVAAGKFSFVSPPVITAILPTEGPTSGGTVVAITGTGLTGATAVKFGISDAVSFVVNSDTSMTATSPPGMEAVDVVVTTPAGSTAVGTKFAYVGTPVVVAKCTETLPVGNDGAIIPKAGVVLVMPPSKYGTKLHGRLSVVLPAGAALDDVVEMYATSGRFHFGILVSVFPPVGESINGHPVSDGTNSDAASSVTSNSGRMFRKVSATNWQSLGGGND